MSTDRRELSESGPLRGVRVVELGVLLAGPFVGRVLGDFGADIIKVEDPSSGDPLREWGQHRFRGRALWWPVQSRNKRLVTLNLRAARGQDLCRDLLKSADVLVENFRPGTLERWGLGPDDLWKVNPRLIIARVSGYGQTGPYASRAGFASAGEAMGGLRYINGYPGQAPPRIGISLGDSLAAMFAAQGILMALYWRDALGGGRGQVIDASIMESCFALLESAVPEYGKLGVVREPSGTVLKHVAPSNVYRTRDDKWLVIAANAENLWQRLCIAVGRPDLIDDERFKTHWDRGQNMEVLDTIISEWVVERNAEEVDRILNDAGVVCGGVYSVADIFADAQYQSREMLIEREDQELGTVVGPGVIPKLSHTPGEVRHLGPWALGAHNSDVYHELGYSDEEIAALAAQGVI